MHSTIKYITLGLALTTAFVAKANNPGLDNLKNANEVLPETEKTVKDLFKINTREVEDVFLKIKRVDKLLAPKKRLTKKKYTIA